MTTPKICLVATTIGEGDFLDGYVQQIDLEGLAKNFKIVIIPDRKSPASLYKKCADIYNRGIDLVCPSMQEQESFIKKIGNSVPSIPYDSDNRRNVGFLMALQWGSDVLISLDDDNFCITKDSVYEDYSIVCRNEIKLPAVHSSNGWCNICDFLEITPNYSIYPRGFPYKKKHQEATIGYREESGLVRLNAGLWIGDPDLDAVTWLAAPAKAKSFKGNSVLLGQNTWSPINTQNTSLHRDLIQAYYYIPMGYPIAGMTIDRYGDIFSGFFCQACVRHLGHRIRIGTPIALHRRNAHNYMRDLVSEVACIWIIEEMIDWLCTVKLEGTDYAQAYLSLADALEGQVSRFSGFIWTDDTRRYFNHVTRSMRQWVSACKQLY